MSETVIAYCVKCKDKSEIANGERVVLKNGRHAIKGNCKKCGTKIFKITKATKG